MVKTVMKKGILLITLLIVTLFLSSCFSLGNSGDGSKDDFSVEDSFSTESEFSSDSGIIDEDSNTDDGIIDKVVRCEIIFDSAGGTAVASQIVLYGEKIEKPSDPTKPNDSKYEYSFDGWYLGDYAWNFEADTVCEDITLTAKWKIESEFTNPFLPSD